MRLRGLFSSGYVYTIRLTRPDGARKTVTVADEDFELFCQKLFQAGMKFGGEHPDLQVKAGTWR
jgi:hypothetical protein